MVDQSLPMAHISPQIFYFRLKGNIQVDQNKNDVFWSHAVNEWLLCQLSHFLDRYTYSRIKLKPFITAFLKYRLRGQRRKHSVFEESGENVGRGISFSLAKCG